MKKEDTFFTVSSKKKVKFLYIHNSYDLYGGEDISVEQDIFLLKSVGIDVNIFKSQNRNKTLNFATIPIKITINTIRIIYLITRNNYSHIIYSNLYFNISSLFLLFVGKKVKIRKINHNLRSWCIRGTFAIDQEECFECLNYRTSGIIKSCYRNKLMSAIFTFLIDIENWIIKFKKIKILTVSDFNQGLISKTFPNNLSERRGNLIIKREKNDNKEREGIAIVNYNYPEKGTLNIINQWKDSSPNLYVYGERPKFLSTKRNIYYIGKISKNEFIDALSKRLILLFPSYISEPAHLVIEAFSLGIPVLAQKTKSIDLLIKDGYNGYLLNMKDDIKLISLINHIVINYDTFKENTRRCYLKYYKKLCSENKIIESLF